MKYFIKIDRSTIKENKASGDYILGTRECDIYIIQNKIKHHYKTGKLFFVSREITDEADGMSIDIHNNQAWIPTLDRYEYSYLHQTVTCEKCGATFSSNHLRSDSLGDDLVLNICPVCGAPECCEIEYETL